MNVKRELLLFLAGLSFLVGCKKEKAVQALPQEDKAAKQMLQGVWINEDEETVALRAKGDTIFFADSTSQPVAFQIIHDTLVLHDANEVKYQIIKQTPHLFVFKNQNGDVVRLVLSRDPNDLDVFDAINRPVSLNQNQLIKRDTVVQRDDDRYHCYVQVNPTTYKVIKSVYTDDGVAVDNVYHDNIIHVSIFHGASRIFSSDFRKQDFSHKVPKEILRQSILSDMILQKVDTEGFQYIASICIPDSPTSYQVEVTISYEGKLTMNVR